MTTKSYNKEYTAKEAALMLGVHRDTIMYWEEKNLIPPARRNPDNNYRVYSPEEIVEIAKFREIGVVDLEAVERDKTRKRMEQKNKKKDLY